MPRDASAAALIASGLYELCTYVAPEKGKQYRAVADKIVDSLNKHYRAEPALTTASCCCIPRDIIREEAK